MEKEKIPWGIVILFLLLTGVFILSSYISQVYFDEIGSLIGDGIKGKIFYVFLLIFAVVLAPISVTPLIPIASSQWGWPLVFLFTLLGETLGATLAFLIARRYGYPLVEKFVSLKKIHKYEGLVPEKNVFLGVVVIKMVIPVDIINYAIGVLSKIDWKKFILATAIGFIPYAFVVSYIGSLPSIFILTIILAGIILFILIILSGLYTKTNFRKSFEKWWKERFRH